ncbi:MAG: hypothetical protein KatS3mg032_1105 [Cyclobacteriaceae bacterium]|nr:MAG: hypothetical protein KatS3mg032_1105 [Cyclobacteriaceae bacterium]
MASLQAFLTSPSDLQTVTSLSDVVTVQQTQSANFVVVVVASKAEVVHITKAKIKTKFFITNTIKPHSNMQAG